MKNNVNAMQLLSEARHYIYDCENLNKKDEEAFKKTVKFFKEADSILFNSMISNEEAMILQSLKMKFGYLLVNKEAKNFQAFLLHYSQVSGKHLYGASLNMLKSCEAAIVLGCSVSTDTPSLRTSLECASKNENAYIAYMHPLEDEALKSIVNQHIKYEVGSEEGLVAMLAQYLLSDEGKEISKSFFDDLDIGYICGESSVGEEEFDLLQEKLNSCEKCVLVVGADVFNHPKAKNIAKILGAISKYSKFEIVMIPSEVNTLGVSLICDLDEAPQGKTIGYNIKADYTLSFTGDENLDMPSLKQQEGTFTSQEKQVLAFTASCDFDGYTLNDIANALGLEAKRTIDYTAKLPAQAGYKAVAFDDLNNNELLDEIYGYELVNADVKNTGEKLENVDDISEFNGAIVYRCNHSLSLNKDSLVLVGSKQFATAAKVKAGAMVRFEMDGKTYQRLFEISNDLKGTIAYNPVFDSIDNYDEYRYKRVNLEEVNE